jgi:tetratricopeptide (TPR) repeat protein
MPGCHHRSRGPSAGGFAETIWLDPKYEPAYFNRGNAYLAKGEYDQAIADYGEAGSYFESSRIAGVWEPSAQDCSHLGVWRLQFGRDFH